ncbi:MULTISPECIES: sigma-70 family RNA polymerase sigma factor [unclassified Bacillus cereus group]|uniref:RNA polymerase sigma factor n=1 Tax=unclassified Bacillus cereus group TaxID=2750818 RepID=UPI0024CC77D0|nr:MAG: sigma-70 family RNA polymerase sigma factor [Bacillus paranthracis]WAI33942.1 MAG: sigma-70 family RNA polymerase sigma factor [Bacillus paranthracis]WAI37931.1 MAG: sigma-70 family RNA polymerase sigma factor [Bacillus paranthracis]
MSHDTFESLLIEKSKAVFGYLIKIGANRKEAEDIVQDTLYKALLLMEEIPLEHLTPWLFRVAINQHRDLQNPIAIESVVLIGQKSLDEVLLTSELQGEVQEILETMTEEYRHILLLKYEYELSYKEIAILLNMKEETVKTSLYRARNQFKKLYRRRNDESEGL